MSTITASDLKVYQPTVRSAYAERIAKAINDFMAKAKAAFVIEDATVPGDYIQTSFWKTPSGLVSRRITTGTGSDGTPTPVSITQGENTEVRLSRKIGPVAISDDGLRKILSSPEEFSLLVGEMAADGVLEKQISDGLVAAVAALNRSPYRVDKSSATKATLTRTALAEALALRGDRAGDIICWVMHSKVYFDLVAEDLDSSTSTDQLLANVALWGASPASASFSALTTRWVCSSRT